ncbi:MAG TPA: monofunctional biosynthetic peptidoglycan transglycosylase [Rhizomicrobium sp.]|nr:monofunctional biosynthetic peptidoglycan transglycosylase [Rhizomicrobium sp.]
MSGAERARQTGRQGRTRAFFHWLWYGREGRRVPWIRRILLAMFFFAVPAPVVLLLVFRFLPIPFTPSMAVEFVTLNPVRYSWREADAISPDLGRAVIGSEDQNFCAHHGFDWKAIHEAWRDYKLRHKPLRGASTISQQTAREVFLTSWRSIIRKGAEAYLTVLMEALWPKRRIMTVYLNVVDWGHGNFGAEAAAQSYFGVPASRITRQQAARLAAILPSPDRWKAVHPGHYVRRRTGTLMARQHEVVEAGIDWCIR